MGTVVGFAVENEKVTDFAFENGNGGWFFVCKWERWLVLRLEMGTVLGFPFENGNSAWCRVLNQEQWFGV